MIHKRQRPPCPIESSAVPDPVWIPIVAERGWLIVTRDSRIQTHRAEIDAVVSNRARMVALASPDARGKWQQLATLGEDRFVLRSSEGQKLSTPGLIDLLDM